MPKTIEKTVYTFQELIEANEAGDVTELALEKAREWLQEDATDDGWWECTYEQWQEALAQIGFDNVKISFSGFSCQGDGASFTADVDARKLCAFMSEKIEPSEITYDGKTEDFRGWIVKKCGGVGTDYHYLFLANSVSATVKRCYGAGNYSHEGTCEFLADDVGDYGDEDDDTELIGQLTRHTRENLFESFVNDAEELRRDLCHAIYDSLRDEYEDLPSDEYLIDSSEANEWTFDEDGNRE